MTTPDSYYDRVASPVKIHFSEKVVMYMPEIKVLNTEDILFIIDNDFMVPGKPGSWEYISVGLHPKIKQ